jgi:hypothetical protein
VPWTPPSASIHPRSPSENTSFSEIRFRSIKDVCRERGLTF